MSKVLIHTIAFSPDGVSTAYLYNDIALRFKEQGFEVSVLTTTPHYNIVAEEINRQPLKPVLGGLYYKSIYNGITIKHIPQKKFKSSLLRMLGFLYWHFMAFNLGLFERNVNVILSPSPPLTIGVINILLSRIKGCKTIYNVQEIYPDLMIDSGILKSKLIIALLKKIERFVYNSTDAVTTIDSIFFSIIESRFRDSSKLHIIPNFVDTAIYKPQNIDNSVLDISLFPATDALKIMYAGNIGHAQDWNPLIELAIKLTGERIEFFVIGEGVLKDYLEKKIKSGSLSNIHLIPYQPRKMMPIILAYSDMQFIFLSPKTENHGFPSKIYTIMACGKPLLVCSGENTPTVNFLSDKDCAFIVRENDEKVKVEIMANFLKSTNREKLKRLGINGSNVIEKHYSKDVVTQKYVDLGNSLIS